MKLTRYKNGIVHDEKFELSIFTTRMEKGKAYNYLYDKDRLIMIVPSEMITQEEE